MRRVVRVAHSYLRVSAGAQLQGGGLDRQEAAARAWCEANDHQLDTTLDLTDPGISAYRGRNLKQGALGRFLALAEAGQLGDQPVLLIEAVDRVSRLEPLDALSDAFLALTRAGVRIIDLEDGGQEYSRATLNRDPLALVKLTLKIGAAHDYSLRLSRRISAHWEQSRERGRQGQVMRGVGGMKPFWLEVDAAGQWQFNEAVELVRLAFQLAEAHGSGAIARMLNDRGLLTSTGAKWWASSVSTLLRNEAAAGTLVLGLKAHAAALAKLRRWEASPDGPPPVVPQIEKLDSYFPAAVDRATFDRAQRALARRATDPAASARLDQPMHTWLEGLASCQGGGSMTATVERPRGREYRNLRCRKRRYGGGCSCGGRGWRLEQVHAHLLGRLPALTAALARLSSQGDQVGDGEAHLPQQLERAQQQLRAAREASRKGEEALAAAVDQATAVSLLERLNAMVDARQQEVRRAEAELARVQGLIDEEARRPDPAAVLSSEEVAELVTALASGEGTAEQRRAMNLLLKKVNLRVTLSDAVKEAPSVTITIGGSVPMTASFMGEFEAVILRDLFPPARPPRGGWFPQEEGKFLAFGD